MSDSNLTADTVFATMASRFTSGAIPVERAWVKEDEWLAVVDYVAMLKLQASLDQDANGQLEAKIAELERDKDALLKLAENMGKVVHNAEQVCKEADIPDDRLYQDHGSGARQHHETASCRCPAKPGEDCTLTEEQCLARTAQPPNERIEHLEFALRGLYLDNVDYLTRNKLGGMNNHWMRAARIALGINPDDPLPSVEPSPPSGDA